MSWVKIDDSFPSNPKVSALSFPVRWTYVVALCHSARHLTDGVLDKGFLRTLPRGHQEALVNAGLWESDEVSVRIHDFLTYNPSREQVETERQKARERRANGGRTSAERKAVVRANVERTSSAPSRPLRSYGTSSARTREADERPHVPPPTFQSRCDECHASNLTPHADWCKTGQRQGASA